MQCILLFFFLKFIVDAYFMYILIHLYVFFLFGIALKDWEKLIKIQNFHWEFFSICDQHPLRPSGFPHNKNRT